MIKALISIMDGEKVIFNEVIEPEEVTLISRALLYYWARHPCESCPAQPCCSAFDSCPDIGLDLFSIIGIPTVADDIRKRGKIAVEEAIERGEI